MPRRFTPATRTAGPGSALAASNPFAKKQSRSDSPSSSDVHQRQKTSLKDTDRNMKTTKQQTFIGEDLLDWIDENDIEGTSSKTGGASSNAKNLSITAPNVIAMTMDGRPSSPTATTTERVPESAPLKIDEARRALGFDSRCLVETDGVDICGEFNGLVRTLMNRGISLDHIAVTVPSSRAKTITAGIKFIVAGLFMENDGHLLPEPLLFQMDQPEEHSRQQPLRAVPKVMSAKYSWKIFGEMINAIVLEDQILRSESHQGPDFAPLDITLVTTDLAMFCDLNHESHRKAVAAFIARVASFFQAKAVKSIRIVMGETSKLGVREVSDNRALTNEEDSEGEVDDNCSSLRTNQLVGMSNCVHAIQHEIVSQTRAFYQQAVSVLNAICSPMDIEFAVIDHCSTGYKLLSRQMIRKSPVGCNAQARLVMELPELFDGTQCSVAFVATYQTMPAAVDSTAANRLLLDLQVLDGCKLELIQALPHASIDLSLMFGLPIKTRTGIFADFSATQEMQVLTRALFRYLEKEEIVLLLSASIQEDCSFDDSMFYKNGTRTFILIPKECSQSQAPLGILIAYAQADDLIHETSPMTPQHLLFDSEIETQYTGYIERAMDIVKIKPFNPLDVLAVRATTMQQQRHTPSSQTELSDESFAALPSSDGLCVSTPHTCITKPILDEEDDECFVTTFDELPE